MGEPKTTDYEMHPVCPFCEYKYGLFALSDSSMDGDGDTETIECPKCEKEYEVVLNINVTYTSRPVEASHD